MRNRRRRNVGFPALLEVAAVEIAQLPGKERESLVKDLVAASTERTFVLVEPQALEAADFSAVSAQWADFIAAALRRGLESLDYQH